MNSPASSQLWITFEPAECPEPDWINAPNLPGFINYSGGDCRPSKTDTMLTWQVDVRWQKWFVPRFSVLFLLAFTLVPWLLMEPSPLRLVFAILGPICGGSAAAIIYWILDRHEKTGNYLIVDLARRTLTLPRQHVTFAINDVSAFQWMKGRDKADSESTTDFYVVVRDPSNKLFRYHILGSPDRSAVEQLITFSGLPVHEYRLGRGRFRDSDING